VRKVGDGTAHRAVYFIARGIAPFILLFVVFIVIEGVTLYRSAELPQSARRSLNVASAGVERCRPQPELETAPSVVIR